MPATAKDCQISVRVSSETDAWLAGRAGSSQNKSDLIRQLIIRQLIERERNREREEKSLDMFNEAAAHLDKGDFEERESLLGGFAVGQTDLTSAR